MNPGDLTQLERTVTYEDRLQESFKLYVFKIYKKVFRSWHSTEDVFFMLMSNGILLKITYHEDFSSSAKYQLEILNPEVEDEHIVTFNETQTGLFTSDRIAFFIEYYAYKLGTYT